MSLVSTESQETWDELFSHAIELSDLIDELEAMGAEVTTEKEVEG